MLTVIAEKKNISDTKIIIDNKLDCGHIQNVYRLQINDELRVIDGEFEYLTKILSISKKEVVLEIIMESELSSKKIVLIKEKLHPQARH